MRPAALGGRGHVFTSDDHSAAVLLGALSKLLTELGSVTLTLDVPGAEEAAARRDEIRDQLSDYVIPRLLQIEAPLLAVVGGSTGAGKSTLVNSIIGEHVTESGVLRPTTRSPVLVHHPSDESWMLPDRILPDLPRTDVPTNEVNALRLAASSSVPPGLAILDAPDIDSIDEGNRELAGQLLAAADLWLFVTSAARYADQVPWNYLRRAAERSTSVAVVLDRTAEEAVEEVRGHLARMMTARGLSDSPLFTVTESELDADGLLPQESIAPIVGWLHDLAADAEAREAIMTRTLNGAVRHNVVHAHDVGDALDAQREAAAQLRGDVESIYRHQIEDVIRGTADGRLLRGEVLARWQEFVGTGELLRSVEERVGRIRDRIRDSLSGRPTRTSDVSEAVESGLLSLIIEAAESAAESSARSWEAGPAGRALLEDYRHLERASREFRIRAERAVRDWQGGVLDLVRDQGGDKRMTARFLALGVNGVGVALMIVVFAHSAGVTGAEVGIAGGTALVGQKLLEAIFGDQALRDLVRTAHEDLQRRVTALLTDERDRYLRLVEPAEHIAERQQSLREAAREAEDARHHDFIAQVER